MKSTPAKTATTRLELVKSGFSLIRELLIIAIIIICFFRPQTVPQWICNAGFKEVRAFDISVAPECIAKRAAESAATDANILRQSQSLAQQIEQRVPETAVAAFKRAEVLAPEALPAEGWIYLGRVDGSGNNWAVGQPETVNSAPLPLPPGTALVVRDAVYMRADALNAESRSSGKIVSAIAAGQSIEVLDTKVSTANGEHYLWAKVRQTQIDGDFRK